jgi:hypothetical protein
MLFLEKTNAKAKIKHSTSYNIYTNQQQLKQNSEILLHKYTSAFYQDPVVILLWRYNFRLNSTTTPAKRMPFPNPKYKTQPWQMQPPKHLEYNQLL